MAAEKFELWDIYDGDRNLTGRQMVRNSFDLGENEYHLSVLGIISVGGRILITKRAMDKRWAPGAWEIPGGSVMSGESSYKAILREIKEETGLDVSDGELVLSYKRENAKEKDNYILDTYRFELDSLDEENIKIQEEEMTEYRLATRQEIDVLAEEGMFLHYDSIKSVL